MIGDPRIEAFRGMTVVGLHRPMTLVDPAMGELWRAFRLRAGEIGDRTSGEWVSLRAYPEPLGAAPTPAALFEQWAAVRVDGSAPVPAGMDRLDVGAGRYAVFTYRGRADEFEAVARHIYGDWLPGSGYRLAHREFFEILPASYRPDDPDATEEIWIPVEDR